MANSADPDQLASLELYQIIKVNTILSDFFLDAGAGPPVNGERQEPPNPLAPVEQDIVKKDVSAKNFFYTCPQYLMPGYIRQLMACFTADPAVES